MLKLTLYEDNNRTIYISANSIQALYCGNGDTGTYIEMAGGFSYTVCERPEQILAMPEMMYELYPAFSLSTDGSVSKVR